MYCTFGHYYVVDVDLQFFFLFQMTVLEFWPFQNRTGFNDLSDAFRRLMKVYVVQIVYPYATFIVSTCQNPSIYKTYECNIFIDRNIPKLIFVRTYQDQRRSS